MWSVIDRRWKQARKVVARELAGRRALPGLGRTVAVATREVAEPFMVAAASSRFDLPDGLGHVLTLGQGDALSRSVFHLFPPGCPSPEWVLKFARVPAYREPFDRDERGLELAARAGPLVAQRAPRLVGRLEREGLHASLETAAVGRRLRERLQAPGSRAEKLRLVEAVCAWIVDLSRATAAPPERLQKERLRLEREVLTQWPTAGAQVLADLPPLPAILQHNDLGSWNLIFDGTDFTAIDWESAREHGLPLWDLFYFLADALAMIDGAWTGADRPDHTVRLFLGELASSRLLFAWTRRAVTALDLPSAAVGSVATLCWLHHSLSHVARGSALDRFAPGAPSRLHGVEGTAAAWLATPELRRGWTRWGGSG
jgi:hypothetical protein